MGIYRLGVQVPQVAASAFVAPNATLVGSVSVGEKASVWFGVVARGDNEPIAIGAATNVQEDAVLHTDPGFPLTIGANVTVGHQAMLHGCTIGDGSLVGIQAVVMNGAVIGKSCLVGAGAIVTEGKSFPDRSLILGVPAKAVRALTDEEVARIAASAENYAQRGALFRTELAPVPDRG
jgi:carbonic anhydrase/acetyltransferase-like protein (isoleucine patch superfamily)